MTFRGQARFAALALVGIVLMAYGWYDAAGTVAFDDQARPGALAVAGSLAVCTAVVLWTLAGRRAVEQRLANLVSRASELPSTPAARPAWQPADGPLVATATMGRYHRPSCPLANGKPVQFAVRSAHEAAGRRPCGVCQP